MDFIVLMFVVFWKICSITFFICQREEKWITSFNWLRQFTNVKSPKKWLSTIPAEHHHPMPLVRGVEDSGHETQLFSPAFYFLFFKIFKTLSKNAIYRRLRNWVSTFLVVFVIIRTRHFLFCCLELKKNKK